MLTPAVIILAAGAASRFGSPKSLARWGDGGLLAHVIRTTRMAVDEVPWLVLGAHADLIERNLQHENVDFRPLRHTNWSAGLSSSLQAGIAEASRDPHRCAAMIVLGDQPAIGSDSLREMITLWRESPSDPVAAQYAEQLGAPCILPREWFPQVATLRGDQGARSLLRGCPTVRRHPLPAAAWDVDTPDDLHEAWWHAMQSRRDDPRP